jgi:hypothetical protein
MFNEAGQPTHGVVCRGGGGKGGGGGGMSPWMQYEMMQAMKGNQTYTDPQSGMQFSSPEALNTNIQQEQSTSQQQKDTAAQQAADTATQNENTFQANRQQAYNDALANITQTFRGQGVDPSNYMSYINPALQQAQNSVPDLSTNIASYFPTSLGQTILNQATGDQRTQMTNALNQTFTPTYAQNMLPSSIMTQPISDILSKQYDPLSSQLTNALNRGTLNQAGYQAALDKMNQGRSAAQSQLQTLGQNILTGEQTGLSNIASGARDTASNMSLGQTFDPSQFAAQGSTQAAQDIGGFGGALQNAAGNITFSDIQDLLNAGGAVQGATNPTAGNPAQGTGAIGAPGAPTAGQAQQAQQDEAKRGLGSTGAF